MNWQFLLNVLLILGFLGGTEIALLECRERIVIMEVRWFQIMMVLLIDFILWLLWQWFTGHLCEGKLWVSIAFTNSTVAVAPKAWDYWRLNGVSRPFILEVTDGTMPSVDLIWHVCGQHHCWMISVVISIWHCRQRLLFSCSEISVETGMRRCRTCFSARWPHIACILFSLSRIILSLS